MWAAKFIPTPPPHEGIRWSAKLGVGQNLSAPPLFPPLKLIIHACHPIGPYVYRLTYHPTDMNGLREVAGAPKKANHNFFVHQRLVSSFIQKFPFNF